MNGFFRDHQNFIVQNINNAKVKKWGIIWADSMIVEDAPTKK